MKLTKEEIQKVVLACMILAFVLYVYSSMLLGGLQHQEASANATIADLEPKILAAKKQISATRGLQQDAAQISDTLAQIQALIPDGAPVAWFPPQMVDFFKRQGVEKATTRYNGESGVEELKGFKQLAWAIDIPQVSFMPLGIAIAGLENQFPLLEISNVQIEAALDHPAAQHTTLSINTLVKQ